VDRTTPVIIDHYMA